MTGYLLPDEVRSGLVELADYSTNSEVYEILESKGGKHKPLDIKKLKSSLPLKLNGEYVVVRYTRDFQVLANPKSRTVALNGGFDENDVPNKHWVEAIASWARDYGFNFQTPDSNDLPNEMRQF